MKSRPKSQQLPVRRIPVHELFPQPELSRPLITPKQIKAQSAPRKAQVRKELPSKNILWGVVFLGLILTGFGLFGFYGRKDAQVPYVLLEVRALEESGHPVTAADVIVNDKKMGVTDSFGEWHRYLQLRPGDDVKVDLNKSGTISMVGTKTTQVPNRSGSKQDIELQVAISMKGPKSLAKEKAREKEKEKAKEQEKSEANDEFVANTEEFESPQTASNSFKNKSKNSADKTVAEDSSAAAIASEMGDANDSSLGIYFDDGLNRISVLSAAAQVKPSNMMDKRQQDVVRERIIPVLVNGLQNLGLSVEKNSPWKLSLSYVPNGEQVGYIRADIEWHSPFGQTEKSSFIAGFAKTYEETGRGLTSLLRLHMKKTYWAFKENGNWFIDEAQQTKDFWRLKPGSILTDTAAARFPIAMAAEIENGRRWKIKLGKTQPCEAVRQRSRCMVSTESLKEAPPLAGWVMKRVRILGAIPASADVYVAGFQAHPVGNGQWEFWSHSGSNLKAIVLSGGRIIHSEAFVDSPGEAIILKMASNPIKNKAH